MKHAREQLDWMSAGSKLTLKLRLKLCWQILTYTSGHKHQTQVKGLPLFEAGYAAGFIDAMPRIKCDSGIPSFKPVP